MDAFFIAARPLFRDGFRRLVDFELNWINVSIIRSFTFLTGISSFSSVGAVSSRESVLQIKSKIFVLVSL